MRATLHVVDTIHSDVSINIVSERLIPDLEICQYPELLSPHESKDIPEASRSL